MDGGLITSFCSPFFLGIFVPMAAILHALAPRRARPWLLLVISYACFWLISGKLLLLLIVTTLITYLTGLALGHAKRRHRAMLARARGRVERRAIKARLIREGRIIIGVSALATVGILVAAKYLRFLERIASSILAPAGVGIQLLPPAIGIPIGISFYTLQALSYIFDVYRTPREPERNLLRLALFMSFFPQLMEGPICRYEETARQLTAGNAPRSDEVIRSLVRIAWGASKIIIVANRVNLFVKPVFDNYTAWGGTVIAFGAILYTLQLYCDFSGTIDIVIGVARIFGVHMPDNFRQPFFSRTASEFWQRWHITLGTWFRDYVFYPISLSAPVKRLARKARSVLGARTGSVLSGGVALFSVWLLNGLWHGAGWQYLLFGMYYFAIILLSGLFEPIFDRMRDMLGISPTARSWIIFQTIRTWCIVFAGELIFRANGVHAGLSMLGRIASDFSPAALVDGSLLAPGMDIPDFIVVGLFVLALFAHSLWRETGCRMPSIAIRHRSALDCAVCAMIFVAIIVFGAYGHGYVPLDPIYAQF